MKYSQINDLAVQVNTLAVENLELSLTKRRSHFVLYDFDAGFATYNFITFFHRASTANVQTDRSIELERITARGGFRATEHHTDLHTDLVDEDDQAVGVLDVTGDFTQRL